MKRAMSRTSIVMTRRRVWLFRIGIGIVDHAEVEEAGVADGVVVDAAVTTAAVAGTVDTEATVAEDARGG